MPSLRNTMSRILCVLALCLVAPQLSLATQPLTHSNFNVDTYSGPVMGSDRALSLGGAYNAVATGADGVAWNPASFASRNFWEIHWYEWELSLTAFSPGVFGKTDFLNSGHGAPVDDFSFVTLAARLQFGGLGLGLEARQQGYIQSITYSREELMFTSSAVRFGAAYAFWDHQVIVGFSTHTSSLDINYQRMTDADPTSDVIGFEGSGVEAGLLLGFASQPWRLGFSYRSPVLTAKAVDEEAAAATDQDDRLRSDSESLRGLVMPRHTYAPWQLNLGFAWTFGPRPMNRAWRPPHDPVPELRRQLRLRRCQRAEKQLRLEAERDGYTPAIATCPGGQPRPQDPRWRERERDLRRAELRVLHREIDEAKKAIERRRLREVEALPRGRWMLSVDLLVVGASRNTVTMDAFIEQVYRPTADRITLSPRAGVETELIPGRMKLGVGYYFEPARSAHKTSRHHATAGSQVRLFRWDLWGLVKPFDLQAGVAMDLSERYFDLGAGLGFWH